MPEHVHPSKLDSSKKQEQDDRQNQCELDRMGSAPSAIGVANFDFLF
jgi:hypothetical protein